MNNSVFGFAAATRRLRQKTAGADAKYRDSPSSQAIAQGVRRDK
jgi:hypothetical protein